MAPLLATKLVLGNNLRRWDITSNLEPPLIQEIQLRVDPRLMCFKLNPICLPPRKLLALNVNNPILLASSLRLTTVPPPPPHEQVMSTPLPSDNSIAPAPSDKSFTSDTTSEPFPKFYLTSTPYDIKVTPSIGPKRLPEPRIADYL